MLTAPRGWNLNMRCALARKQQRSACHNQRCDMQGRKLAVPYPTEITFLSPACWSSLIECIPPRRDLAPVLSLPPLPSPPTVCNSFDSSSSSYPPVEFGHSLLDYCTPLHSRFDNIADNDASLPASQPRMIMLA